MKFKEILAHVTGVSVPIFGIQWKPIKLEVTVAREVITELEGRRVLFKPYDMEGADPCVKSVLQIRDCVTEALKEVDPKSRISKELRRIRRAGEDFCDIVGSQAYNNAPVVVQRSLLHRELERLRGKVGKSVSSLAIAFGLKVEDDLASIIPFNNPP